MFDAFQNVLFGKKKSSAEVEKASDDFVMIGPPPTEPAPPTETIPSDHLFPKLPFGPSFLPEDPPRAPIMPLQDVPFAINPALHAAAKLDQIWRVIAQSLAAVGSSSPYEEDYDFTLEKSVIAETTK